MYFKYNNISCEQLGNVTPELLEKFYSKDEQKKYGVVGIELKKIKTIICRCTVCIKAMT